MNIKTECQCEIHESVQDQTSKRDAIILGLALVALFLLASVLDTQYLAITGEY